MILAASRSAQDQHHYLIAHRAGGSGNLTASPVTPDQNNKPFLPSTPQPSPCKLDVELFLWDGPLTDAVPNLFVRTKDRFGFGSIRLFALIHFWPRAVAPSCEGTYLRNKEPDHWDFQESYSWNSLCFRTQFNQFFGEKINKRLTKLRNLSGPYLWIN